MGVQPTRELTIIWEDFIACERNANWEGAQSFVILHPEQGPLHAKILPLSTKYPADAVLIVRHSDDGFAGRHVVRNSFWLKVQDKEPFVIARNTLSSFKTSGLDLSSI